MVENSQVFHEAVADKTATDNGQRWVFVDRARGRNTEVLTEVVLQRISRQDIQGYIFDTQFPFRQVAHVFEEQTLRLVRLGVDISVRACDEKCRTVENANIV